MVGVGELDAELTGRRVYAALVLAAEVEAEGRPAVEHGVGSPAWAGGRYPPPAPVHAVSIIARMPAAARTMDRRYNRGVPVFTVSSEAVRREGPGGRAKVHDVGDFPDVQGLMSGRTGVWTAYPAQMLKLRKTQELGCCAGFGSSPRDDR